MSLPTQCPHCGAENTTVTEYDCCTKNYGRKDRSRLCREREKSQKLEAEVERLKVYLARAVEIAMIIWGDKTCDKPWPELRAELDQIKQTLNPTNK